MWSPPTSHSRRFMQEKSLNYVEAGFPHGGCCLRGRLAEDGIIPECFQLTQTESTEYVERTACNVRDSVSNSLLVCTSIQTGS